jgi:hypothetical protein
MGIQLVWTGTPTGTFDIQVSLDHRQDAYGNVTNPGTWSSLTISPSPSSPAGSASNTYIDINQLSAPYVRVVYTKGSGDRLAERLRLRQGSVTCVLKMAQYRRRQLKRLRHHPGG